MITVPPLRPAEAAARLGVTSKTLARWVAEGKLTCIRVGERGQRRYRAAEIEALVSGEGDES